MAAASKKKKSITRAGRAAAKKTSTGAFKSPMSTKPEPAVEPDVTQKLSNVYRLSMMSIRTLWQNKKLFAGVLSIYALLSIVFVSGLGAGINVSEVRDQFANRLLGGLSAYTQLLTSSASSSDPAAGVYQLFLTLVISLALIWALRQVYAGNPVRIRDVYYKSMGPMIPFILVLLYLCLQLLPLLIASSAYQFVIVTGVAATLAEEIIWLGIALLGALVSAYLITSTLLALIIVTLPDMPPVKAIKLAKKLVKGRRLKVLRKLLFMPVVLLVVTIIILLPAILIFAPLAQLLVLILGPILIALAHSYVYVLYRELMND